ncbi:hypothetical protein ACWCXE_31365 [Streptomyces sp. NPDC001780]
MHLALVRKSASLRSFVGKAVAVAALSAAAIGLTAPVSSAANEDNWTYGCRGYWYDTSGHGYCKGAEKGGWYRAHYACTAEGDSYQSKQPGRDFVGKFSKFECIFNISRTTVTYKD